MVVCDLLVKNFPYIFDTAYTAKLEEELDDIEEGKEKWTDLMNGFYDHFVEELKDAGDKMEDIKRMEMKTDEKCDLCGSPLLLKWGKFGSFFACSAYNKKDKSSCTFTKENTAGKPDMNTPEGQEAAEQEEYCDNCGRVMVLRRGPFGMFMSCPGFNEDPPCKTFRKLSQKQQQKVAAPQPVGEDCPQCGKPLVLRQGAYGEFVSCSGYPKCKYVKQNIIEGLKCPKCGVGDLAERKARRGNIFWGCTNYPKCDFTSNNKPVAEKMPGVQESVSGRKDSALRHLSRMPQQEEGHRGRNARAQEESSEIHQSRSGTSSHRVQLLQTHRRRPSAANGRDPRPSSREAREEKQQKRVTARVRRNL